MKKFILSMLSCGLLFFSAQAQLEIEVIPKAGLSLGFWSDRVDGEPEDSNLRPGLAIGAALGLGINELISIQPELLFIQKGGSAPNVELKRTINYLELPVLARFNFSGFHVAAGPYLGFALGGKLKTEEGERNLEIGSDEANDDLKPLDFGAYIGGGYSLDIGSGKLMFDARLGWGFPNLLPGGDSDFSYRSRNYVISVGYVIPLGK